jgi:hypothetical protein
MVLINIIVQQSNPATRGANIAGLTSDLDRG